ncbi:MAG: exopolysaccharide biosynthesis polyprenyl glycosylphosphotransferase [Candidatus Dojkabacteria bacterium]|nr:MAG: exopolysaccharide biosynthesis polyprenyl glycosylphosphotransferase [Candidatus Dojkabacteria bacterium]
MNNLLKRFSWTITLVASDISTVIFAFFVSFLLRDFIGNFITIPALISNDPIDYQLTNWWIIPLYFIVFWTQGLYTERRPFWHETKSMMRSIVIASLLIYTIISFGRLSPYVSRIIFVLHPFLMAVFIPLSRRIIKLLMFRIGLWKTPIVEIKLDTDYSLGKVWNANGYIGFDVIAEFKTSLNSQKKLEELAEDVRKVVKANNVETISIITDDITDKKLSHLVEKLYFIAPQIILIPEFMPFDVINADVYHMMYENLFVFDIKKGLTSFSNRVLKRVTDFFIAAIGLIVASPIMLLTAIIIYLMDGAPVVYTQERYGKDGKIFRFMKFRTMYKNNDKILAEYLQKNPDKAKEWNTFQKLKGEDPRLIKFIGYWLRKLDFDELPQLFNVLFGQMSVIGPRPYLPRERDMIGNYFARILSVKPGITGLWQATGRNDFTFKQRLDIDTWYIQNWSLWLDFIILFKTVRKILS